MTDSDHTPKSATTKRLLQAIALWGISVIVFALLIGVVDRITPVSALGAILLGSSWGFVTYGALVRRPYSDYLWARWS